MGSYDGGNPGGRFSFLGVNVAVANNVSIGKDNFVGIGAIITRNTKDDQMWRAPPSTVREVGPRKMFGIDS